MLFRECAGWAADPSNHPTRSPSIPILPKVALHPALPSDRVIPALSLVQWYTQHPSRRVPSPLQEMDHVSIIGRGHIALDSLAKYDVLVPVLDVLRRSTVCHVSITDRRGAPAGSPRHQGTARTYSPRRHVHAPPRAGAPRATHQQQQRVSPEPGPSRTKTWSLDFFRSPTSLSTAPGNQQLAPKARRVRARRPDRRTSVQHIVTALGHHADPAAAYVDPGLGHLRTGRGGGCWTPRGAHYGASMRPADYDADAENSEDALVADDTVDPESVPVEVEEGVRAIRPVEEGRRGGSATRCGDERERMGWEEAHDFLTSTGAWESVEAVIWHHISIWSYLYVLTKKSDCVFSVRPLTKA
ncbi:hypothetical protein EDB89DRAFT_2071095 [Lactarius sanguifluus]|nr:hypothetical protein EDB89DRAFT_2071095 [Lactarius sanguifluus]